MEQNQLWILKSFSKDVSFGGNEGYNDDPEFRYIYDNTVINHDRIKKGDYVIIVDKKHVTGTAVIEDIKIQAAQKMQYSCPICGTKKHHSRKRISPQYKCKNQHEFEEPLVDVIEVSQYEALYTNTFQKSKKSVSVKILDDYYINRNIYYSIQPAMLSVLDKHFPQQLKSKPPIRSSQTPAFDDAYIPSVHDSREYKMLKSTTRPQQNKFRKDLFKMHGLNCMISDCSIPEAIEASHICPYRGLKDNHPCNGILLRKDLHALFDADLIGVEPGSLKIHLSPVLINTYYERYNNKSLNIQNKTCEPSNAALQIRWQVFNEAIRLINIEIG